MRTGYLCRMAKPKTYMVKEIAEEFRVSPSRISQMIRGYVRSDGTVVEPELVEGEHYVYEVREFKGKVRTTRRVVPVLTDEGRKAVKRITGRTPGRQAKKKEGAK